MQACNDAGLNSFQIFGMHVLVYILTLGATGLTILSALGIAQLAKDAKDTFNNWNAGRKLNPQKVKEIVKDFENKVVEITRNVLVQLYKQLWTRRSFWANDLRNSPN